MRHHLLKRDVRDFMPVFERLFSCDEVPSIAVLAMFHVFVFYSWSPLENLQLLTPFLHDVVDELASVIFNWSEIEDMQKMVPKIKKLHGEAKKIRELKFHPLLKDLLKKSLFFHWKRCHN